MVSSCVNNTFKPKLTKMEILKKVIKAVNILDKSKDDEE